MSSILILIRRTLLALTIVTSLLVSSTPTIVYAANDVSGHITLSTKEVKVMAKSNPFANKLYDASIKKWSSIYTPQYPWYWNKAQLIAESALNPNAVSAVGAKGLGQFMPGTWNQAQSTLGFTGSVFTPSLNIQAQAWYMGTLMNQFKKDRPLYDRYSLALASYNAGLGNILTAQRIGGNSLFYAPMAAALPTVTGKHSVETTDYVNRIWSYIDVLIKLEGEQK